MLECDPKGGHVIWLENPGRDNLKGGKLWKEHYVGRWPAMHRVKIGHFTQKSFLEIVAASVVYGQHDKTTPIPIIRFQQPHKVTEATEWSSEVIDDENFTIIHELTPRKLDGPDGLDSLIVSSREGTTILSFDKKSRLWNRKLVGIGEPKEPWQTPDSESPGSGDHWGAGATDIGKVGNDPYAYIATMDPFHGTTVAVYTKIHQVLNGDIQWKRHCLDVFGTPNQLLKTGDGPGHFVVCADFDGDGDDEFLVSIFGPLDRDESDQSIPPPPGRHPLKGIMYYKPIDLDAGIFAKWRVAEESSARIALGDFSGKGKLDLVSMSYNVERYYEEPNPVVTLHLNKTVLPPPADKPAIIPTLWENEGLVYLKNPSAIKNAITAPSIAQLVEIADYAISVEVYPRGTSLHIGKGDGLKVLFGSLMFPKEDGGDGETRQPFSVPGFTVATTATHAKRAIADKKLGASRSRPHWPSPHPLPSKLPSLQFNKVDTLWWGEPFKGVDFYNLSGFHFRFLPETSSCPTDPIPLSPLAHIQFWTAAPGVNCGVHNHGQDTFCELHVCLSPGSGNGGMARLKQEYADAHDPSEYNKLPKEAFDWLPMKQLEEHGGLWDRDSDGRPKRTSKKVDTIRYPWHKWEGGDQKGDVDVWMAIEFDPRVVDQAVDNGQQT
ncbi:hypothetical protein PG988_014822 [Apiospora saccharicola]